jgi:hypothetical protein
MSRQPRSNPDEPLALGDPRFLDDPEVGRRDFLVAALP